MPCNQDVDDPAQAPCKSMGNSAYVKASDHRDCLVIARAPSIPRNPDRGDKLAMSKVPPTSTGSDYRRVASFSTKQPQPPARTKNSASQHHAETQFAPAKSKVAASTRGQSTSTGADTRSYVSFSDSPHHAETQIVPARTKNSASADQQIAPVKVKVPAYARSRSTSRGPDYRRVASFSGSQLAKMQIAPAKIMISPRATQIPDAGGLAGGSFIDHSSRQRDMHKPRKSRGSSSTVFTPEQNPGVEQGITSSRLPRRLYESKGFARNSNELCKYCKSSNLESICYIANDGRIAAAKLTGPSVRHVQHCKTARCSENPDCHLSSKYPVSQRSSSLSKVAKASVCAKKCLDVESSSNPSIREFCMFHSPVQSIGDGEENFAGSCDSPQNHCPPEEPSQVDADMHSTDGTSTAGTGYFPCKDDLFSEHSQSGCIIPCLDQNCLSGHHQNDNLSCRANDVEDQQATGCSTCIIDQSKCYHADNELSCSEDGTDTPLSASQNAFSDLLNADIDQPSSTDKHLTRSRIARMRRKYLDTLREQEAETVRLRKQEIEARKNVGDWMIDCAMEELLHRLAPNGEARVKVLVEAFETIIHHSDSDLCQHAELEPEHQNKAVHMHC